MDPPGPSEDPKSLYAALGIPRTASEEEIRRAYRQLATSLHPDKAQAEELREDAARLFTVIQEAYEVLSNPEKRDIYDVYGREGLAAGLELGDHVKTKDELRKEWEQFRQKQEAARIEAQVNYRGAYMFRTDATALVRPYSALASRMPDLTNIYMTSEVDIPVDTQDWGPLASQHDVLHLGGLVSVRKNVGGGSFIAGYKRIYEDYSTYDVHAAVGLKSLFSVSSGIQLSQHSQASLTGSWQPGEGIGLQLLTSRQLSRTIQGEYAWTVGPEAAAGMSLGLTRRLERTTVTARVEVGASTGIMGRLARKLGAHSTARAGFKLGLAGLEVDVGGHRQLSEVSVGGLGVVAGPQGVVLKLRYNRAGHVFEFPVLLAPTVDYAVLAGAYALPPLLYYVVKEVVIGPLARAIKDRRQRARRLAEAETVRKALTTASAAAELLGPVAARQTKREADNDGLVVALGLYGARDELEKSAAERCASQATLTEGSSSQVPTEPQPASSSGGSAPPQEPAAASPAADQAAADRGGSQDELTAPPAVADVTVAVQYMVEAGKAVFYKDYPKSGLVGFCDPSPGGDKALLILFSYKGRPCKAWIGDLEAGILPARGEAITDAAQAAFVAAAVQRFKAA